MRERSVNSMRTESEKEAQGKFRKSGIGSQSGKATTTLKKPSNSDVPRGKKTTKKKTPKTPKPKEMRENEGLRKSTQGATHGKHNIRVGKKIGGNAQHPFLVVHEKGGI